MVNPRTPLRWPILDGVGANKSGKQRVTIARALMMSTGEDIVGANLPQL
jgi:hypothetical protein